MRSMIPGHSCRLPAKRRRSVMVMSLGATAVLDLAEHTLAGRPYFIYLRARSLGTSRQPALRLFQTAPHPHRDCRSLRQMLRCEHTLQSVSDRRRPQTNIHSSARSGCSANTRSLAQSISKPLMMRFIMADPRGGTLYAISNFASRMDCRDARFGP